MILNSTGYLDFAWSKESSAEGYYVKIYKNDTFYKTYQTITPLISISGLREGCSVFGYAYPYSGSSISEDKIHLNKKHIPISNFHNQGKTFKFNEIYLNKQKVNCETVNDCVNCSGISNSKKSHISFSLVNPRDDLPLNNFGSEPFLSGITYRTESYESNVNSFDFIVSNDNLNSRHSNTQFVVNDVYGSGITGNLLIYNEPVKISKASISNIYSDNFSRFEVSSKYNYLPQKLDYCLCKDKTYSDYILSGSIEDVHNFSFNISENQSGYLKITPYDWHGSGISYFHDSLLFHKKSDDILKSNKIEFLNLDKNKPYGKIHISANHSNASNFGSYYTLSIDDNPKSSFDSNSFFTGQFNDVSFDFDFDYFTQFKTQNKNIDFYVNVNLYDNNNHSLQDSKQKSIYCTTPNFTDKFLDFDYQKGITTLSYTTSPYDSFSGIDLLVSKGDNSCYEICSGGSIQSNDLHACSSFRLVHSLDHDIVFDELLISGSGLKPRVTSSEIESAHVDGVIFSTIDNLNLDVKVNEVEIYRKPVFFDLSEPSKMQSLSSELYSTLKFDDYEDHFYKTGYIGYNQLEGPNNITRNTVYSCTGLNFSGSYESGQYYSYRFLPKNGYGDGLISSPIVYEFHTNGTTNSIHNDINELKNSVIDKDFIFDHHIPFKSNSFIIDYSDHNFVNPPLVLTNLMSTVPGSPIVSTQISGSPDLNKASFTFSEPIPNSGYKLHGIAKFL